MESNDKWGMSGKINTADTLANHGSAYLVHEQLGRPLVSGGEDYVATRTADHSVTSGSQDSNRLSLDSPTTVVDPEKMLIRLGI